MESAGLRELEILGRECRECRGLEGDGDLVIEAGKDSGALAGRESAPPAGQE